MSLLMLAASDTTFTAIIVPYLPFAGIVVGALIIESFRVWNRKRGAVEARSPNVNDLWQKQATDSAMLDNERSLRRWLEDFIDELRDAFREYTIRAKQTGETELSPEELALLTKKVPTIRDIEEGTKDGH